MFTSIVHGSNRYLFTFQMLEVKSVWHNHIPPEKVHDEASMGKLCGEKVIRFYQIKSIPEFCSRFMSMEPSGDLVEGDTNVLADACAKNPDHFAKQYLMEKYFTVCWVSY